MNIDFVIQGYEQTVGLSRYTSSLLPELRQRCCVSICPPDLPDMLHSALNLLGDAESFFASFPLSYQRPSGDILHISSQTMGLPLLYRDYGSTVITVHDIFPYIFARDTKFDPIETWYERMAYRFSMRALHECDHIIAISEATKQALQEYLGLPEEKITRIYYGVNHQAFQPIESVSPDIYEQFGLEPNNQHVLYVGSERPRKAVPELLRAFAKVTDCISDAVLIKVGGPEIRSGRKRLNQTISAEGIEDQVVFTGHVEEGLTGLYNIADVYASAAYYEGFGLPFVEAMACGTPVVARNQSAMPEVVREGGVLFEDQQGLVELLIEVLDNGQSQCRRKEARENAKEFSWREAASKTRRVYESVRRG